MSKFRTSLVVAFGAFTLAACDNDPVRVRDGFLGGTTDNPQIGLVLNSVGGSLNLFQLGNTNERVEIPLGTGTTATAFSVRADLAAVPLGDAASVALIDLADQRIARYFIFPSGNATGSAFVNDTTVLAANLLTNQVGRFTRNQQGDTIRQTAPVAQAPSSIVVERGRAFVLSSRFNFQTFAYDGTSVVTVLDPANLQTLDTLETGFVGAADAAVGPDGLLYVIHSGGFDPNTFAPGEGVLTVIDPATLRVTSTVRNVGRGPSSITIDERGLAYISGYGLGTLVFNTRTRTFVRGPDNPVCARDAQGGCRGAPDAAVSDNGDIYQAIPVYPAGPSWVYVFRAPGYVLADSVAAGADPTAVEVRRF